ncbi:MAG: hypothetical protein PHC83_07180 [Bacteroidales bacterium]|jgi:hypothetical protein|nr:hypothetical protein [Bacteroidales bacterium]MDD4210409.1 hypothetical protein [Bacteroidales bacterium]MDY0015606.1 hypothetical protein [Bacteroidales bacterium]
MKYIFVSLFIILFLDILLNNIVFFIILSIIKENKIGKLHDILLSFNIFKNYIQKLDDNNIKKKEYFKIYLIAIYSKRIAIILAILLIIIGSLSYG